MSEMRQIVILQKDGSFKLALEFFRHHNEKIEYEWENGEPKVGVLFSQALLDLLGPVRQNGEELIQRHMDIARSVQAMYEEAFFHLLITLHAKYGGEELCLAGGCAMNSVANGKVYRNTPFKRTYIQSAAGDAGGAIGADMKDILNLKIKRRESFRPFAPSILREAVSEWFEQDDDVPFMMQVYPIRKEVQALIPAVTHVDGSGRLQTVTAKSNPRYHKLISKFGQMTGVPILLNTSFNENEPVVCNPKEALNCFLRTKMDVLVLGNWMVQRV
jgi:predicted NodU family carbamoyl transferase